MTKGQCFKIKSLVEVESMKKKENTMKIAAGSFLALVLVAAGVTVYQSNTQNNTEEQKQLAENITEEETESEYADVQNANSDEAKAVLPEEESDTDSGLNTSEEEEMIHKEENNVTQNDQMDENSSSVSAEVKPVFHFSEDSLMEYPVSGQIVLDYSMDGSIYFPTLEVYKYNPAVVLSAEVGTPVKAAAAGEIVAVSEDPQTGTTVTMDIGDGYQLTYGQLSELTNIAGNTVSQGEIIGYVAEPTKYYTKEGSNLYFAMTKDGESVDPMLYMESGSEE